MAASAHEVKGARLVRRDLTDTREWIFRLTWPESGAVFASLDAMIPLQAHTTFLMQGDVSIDFYVKKDGKVEGIKIINIGRGSIGPRSLGQHYGLEPFPPCHRVHWRTDRRSVSLFLQRPAGSQLHYHPSFDVRVQSLRSPILSFRGGSGAGPVRWSVSA